MREEDLAEYDGRPVENTEEQMGTNEEILQVVRGKFSDGEAFQASAVASEAGASVADVTAVLDAAVVAGELTVATEAAGDESTRVFRYVKR